MFGCLPKEGGLLDQDPYHLMLLEAGYRAFDKKEQYDMEEKTRSRR